MALLTPIGQDKGPITGRSMIITPVTKVTFLIGGEKIDHSIIYAGTIAYCFFKKVLPHAVHKNILHMD